MQPQELVVSESRKLSCEMPALRRRVCRIYVHVFVVMARMGLTLRRGTDRDTYASTRLAWCSASYCMRQCAPPGADKSPMQVRAKKLKTRKNG